MNQPLARLLAGRKRPYGVLITLWILLRVTILLTGLLLQAVFNALSGGSMTRIWILVGVLAVNEAIRWTLWYGVVLSRLEVGYTFTVRFGLQERILREALRRPGAKALDRPVGDFLSRLGADADEVSIFAVWSASNISRLVIAVIAITIMVNINPWATASLAVPIIAVTYLGRRLNGPVGRYRTASREAAAEVSTIVGETVNGLQALKVGRAESRMLARMEAAGEVRSRAAVRDEGFLSLQQAVFRCTGALGVGLVLLVVAAQMRQGRFSVGDLALFVFYIQFITEAVDAFGMFMGRIKRATLSLARIGEVSGGVDAATRCLPVHLNGVSPEAPPPPAREQLRSLRATGLAYCHPGSDRGVAEIDVELDRGTLTVVTGPVGSGKSTLVRTLLGLLPADRGEIRWNDERVDDPAGFFVPPRVAYVPQVPRLFSGTLRENIVLGAAFDDEEVFRAVRMAALEPDVALMPDGLDTLVGMRGLRLSGGQIQRVAVARMIIRDPELMVLDDASNALDVDTERELWSNLLAHGRTVLAVSNRPELVSGADQVIRLERGPTGVTATERAQSVEAGA